MVSTKDCEEKKKVGKRRQAAALQSSLVLLRVVEQSGALQEIMNFQAGTDLQGGRAGDEGHRARALAVRLAPGFRLDGTGDLGGQAVDVLAEQLACRSELAPLGILQFL